MVVEKVPSPEKLIDLSKVISSSAGRRALDLCSPLVERVMGVEAFNAAYHRVKHETPIDWHFFERALVALRATYDVSEEDLAKIPQDGPLVVVANHPFGGLDGIVLGDVLLRARPDVKLLANYLLGKMEEINPWLLSVDPFGGESSAKSNLRSMRDTLKFLREGGCVGTFPSGTVSHLKLKSLQVTDPQWVANTARLIEKSQATVLPIYFEGQNSWFFQAAGLLHPLLRTMLLPREMDRRISKGAIRLKIGNPIPYRKLAGFQSGESMMQFLRLKTYILKRREFGEETGGNAEEGKVKDLEAHMEPLAESIPATTLLKDVKGLPDEQLLTRHGDFEVYYGSAEQIPNLLKEIGRLREKTFRDVFEGTGKSRDLDVFDAYYLHLFMWDVKANAIVGAYRMGMADKIIAKYGKRGLYTSTLFKYKSEFLDRLQPALEVGRSFIASEYQKKHASLSLIWRGIGQFVVRNPDYKTLFGPVSINREYLSISKDLMVRFLRKTSFDSELSPLVKAKHPPRHVNRIRGEEKRALLSSVRDIDDVSALVSEIEKDRKGIPILLKHYLKLKGRLVSFNVDSDFGQCLDGLIIVDLTQSDEKLLKSYLTPEGLKSFLEYNRRKESSSV